MVRSGPAREAGFPPSAPPCGGRDQVGGVWGGGGGARSLFGVKFAGGGGGKIPPYGSVRGDTPPPKWWAYRALRVGSPEKGAYRVQGVRVP